MNNKKVFKIKLLQTTLVMLFLFYIPIAIFLELILDIEKVSEIFGFIWLAMFAINGIILIIIKCPNCGKRFFRYKLWSTKCANCNFSILNKTTTRN